MKYRNQLGPNAPQNQKQQNSIRGVVNFEKGQKRANRDIARQGVNFENVLPVLERLQFYSVQQLRKTEMLKFNWFYYAPLHNMKWMCTKPQETLYENTHAQHKEFRSQRALLKTLPQPKESRGHCDTKGFPLDQCAKVTSAPPFFEETWCFPDDLVIRKVHPCSRNTSFFENSKPPTSRIQRKRAGPKGSATVLLIIRIEEKPTIMHRD